MPQQLARFVLSVIGAVVALVCLGTPGLAQGQDEEQPAASETVQGLVRNGQQPLPDVRITVSGPDGFSEEGTTNAEGRWVVPVPGPGQYEVELVADSLPADVTLRFPDRNPVTTTVNGGQQKAVLFPLGADTRVVESRADQALNRFAGGLRFGLLIALAAVGLSLIFGTTGLTNFAHGELVTAGGLSAYFFNTFLGMPLLLAALATMVVCGVLGWLLDAGLWKPLRGRGTGLIAAMIVSIGLSILLRYAYLYQVGGSTISLSDAQGQTAAGPGPITLTGLDYLSMLISVVALVLAAFFLLRTRTGKATRAVADNPALASASGIDVDRVIRIVWVSGAALAGLSGVLLGVAQQVNFQMGFQILLLVFAAVTLGGLGTAWGALIGSLVVGVFIQLSTLVIPAELKNVGVLAVLIIILLVRPQGILGRAQRVG